ncbi:hypothetical protein C7B77_07440 [Chamaesiphon polymorphus CCALA 037]|uniref:Uncharacterized protein n=1 Tax=Chamaesiphon polymorphus CCALA 037 TaxID=2107692 RepID=A0A2T1GIX6_9CYAN|nr:hypothetical protein C7B77_07440 [Chamaesiphon polymorphus CCALA 037]
MPIGRGGSDLRIIPANFDRLDLQAIKRSDLDLTGIFNPQQHQKDTAINYDVYLNQIFTGD